MGNEEHENSYDGTRATDRREQQWHLDKKIPISLIITILTLGISGLIAITDIKKDVEVLKSQVQVLRERDDRQASITTEGFQILRTSIEKISDKLDRVLEGPRK